MNRPSRSRAPASCTACNRTWARRRFTSHPTKSGDSTTPPLVPLENRIRLVTCGSSGCQAAREYSLIRPVGAENLCHQAIFMNHAPCAVTSLNPELIQVGDAIG